MGNSTNLTVVFRARSEIEASIGRGLARDPGIGVSMASDIPHAIFPLSISGLGEVRLSVHPDRAGDAQRLIEDHLDESAHTMGPDPQGLDRLEAALGYDSVTKVCWNCADASVTRA